MESKILLIVVCSILAGGCDLIKPEEKPKEKASSQKAAAKVAVAEEAAPASGCDQFAPEERAVLGMLKERAAKLDERVTQLDRRELELRTIEKNVDMQLDKLRTIMKEVGSRVGINFTTHEERAQQIEVLAKTIRRMKPKRAAAVLSTMAEDTARPVVRLLEIDLVSRLLNEMDSERAAMVAAMLVDKVPPRLKKDAKLTAQALTLPAQSEIPAIPPRKKESVDDYVAP